VEGEEPVHVVDGEVSGQWKEAIVFSHLRKKKSKMMSTTYVMRYIIAESNSKLESINSFEVWR
jgi:hypothetical protein